MRSLSPIASVSASKFTGTEITERSSSVHLRISLQKCQFFPSNGLPYIRFESKNCIRGNVVTDNQLTAIGSDTHFGFSREVQKSDNRNPRALSFQPPTRRLSAFWRIFVTWCSVSAELVYKSTFAASCFENTVVGSILGNGSSSPFPPFRLCSHQSVQLTVWDALSMSVNDGVIVSSPFTSIVYGEWRSVVMVLRISYSVTSWKSAQCPRKEEVLPSSRLLATGIDAVGFNRLIWFSYSR